MSQRVVKEQVYCEYEKGFVNKQLSCFLGKDRNGKENDCWERPVKCGQCIYSGAASSAYERYERG